jgi:hypothetical protein
MSRVITLICRVRDFCCKNETLFLDPGAGADVVGPGWARKRELWVREAVWRLDIFGGVSMDSDDAALAMADRGLLRGSHARLRAGWRPSMKARIGNDMVLVFAVNRSILHWEPPGRLISEDLVAGHAGVVHKAIAINGGVEMQNGAAVQPSNLGEHLERTLRRALDEADAILDIKLDDPEARNFGAVLKAKTTILSAVLNGLVRVDELRFSKKEKDTHDAEVEAVIEARRQKVLLQLEKMREEPATWNGHGGHD